jgi:acyl carrier protein
MKSGNWFSGVAERLGFRSGGQQQAVRDQEGIRAWLIQRLAKQLKVAETEIDTAKRFDAYGLDSRVAIQIAGEIEKLIERRISPALLFEYPTIDEVASVLAKEAEGEAQDDDDDDAVAAE